MASSSDSHRSGYPFVILASEAMISVIIPVFNVVEFLPACLDSVIAQTFRDFELLLVDDGSTDGSGDICDDYACRDPRVSVLHQTNSGPSAARNAALDVAKGDYVAFIDSDDEIHPRYLDILYRYIVQDDADIAQVPYQILDAQVRSSQRSRRQTMPLSEHPKVVTLTGEEALMEMLYQRGTADSSPCKLFRRSLFDALRFPEDYRVYEDLYLMAQLYSHVRKMVWIDLPMYFYFKQPSGTLCSLSTQRRDAFEVLEKLEAEYLASGQRSRYRAVRERRLSVAFNILRLLSNLPHTDQNIVMAHLCWRHIIALRSESIRDSQARFKNRVVALASYLLPRPKFGND